ncbi:20S proteasome subunit beta 7 [Pseudohyphozyma bogoriensis]|nr:20S proteasome subunit beta 7 [Pseudohyphozyma bogoriensis]
MARDLSLDGKTLRKRLWRRQVTPFQDILDNVTKGSGTEDDPFIVEFFEGDLENPLAWSDAFKWTLTAVVAVYTFCVALASSAYSGAGVSIIETFKVSNTIYILGISLFVLGFALGPLIWAPVGEVMGRRNTFIATCFLFTAFNAGAAASQNIETLIVLRFLGGMFSSSCLAKSLMPVNGVSGWLPSLGPIVGGFLSDAAGFRWVEGLLAVFSGILLIIGTLFIPETYTPRLLRLRAVALSEHTGLVYRAPMDAEGALQVGELFQHALTRPWRMLFLEPIVTILALYLALSYAFMYMEFSAFPIVFQQAHHWNSGIEGLTFLGLMLGMISGAAWVIFYENPRYVRVVEACGGRAPPEARLPPATIGAVIMTVGLALFAGTCGRNVPWIVPILAQIPFGLGSVLIFLALTNYLGKPRNDALDPYATFPVHQGRGAKVPSAHGPQQDAFTDGVQRTQQPIVTGTSVLGIKFKDGVMLAADNLASYGSLARFKDIKRLFPVGDSTILGASGDMADFQKVQRMLEDLMTSEAILDDGQSLSSAQIYEYLSNVMYSKRSKMDPYWNAFLVGGLDKGVPFLSYVDLLGTTYSAPSLATGYGNHLAQPLLRRAIERLGPDGHTKLEEADARKIMENAMKVLFYRDARSLNKFQIATVTSRGVEISEPISAPTEWGFAEGLRGYGNSDETY